jgi:hypothetical protein
MDGQEYPAQAQMRLLLLRFDRLRVSAAVQKLPDEAQKQTADAAEDARRSYCHQVAMTLEVQRAMAAAVSLSGKAKANELNRP